MNTVDSIQQLIMKILNFTCVVQMASTKNSIIITQAFKVFHIIAQHYDAEIIRNSGYLP